MKGRTTRWSACAAAAAVATFVLFASACGGDDTDPPLATATPPQATGDQATATPAATEPGCTPPPANALSLTASDQQTLLRAVNNDERIQALTGGVGFTAEPPEFGWETQNGLRFASISLLLDEPVAIDAEVPRLNASGVDEDCQPVELPPPGYVIYMEHREVEAQMMGVIVDLVNGVVVDIVPARLASRG